jgi:hypothetical protein
VIEEWNERDHLGTVRAEDGFAIDWVLNLRKTPHAELEVVQLLGDIDDLVSDQDNKDLASFGADRFVWLRVRGTGHADISNFEDRVAEHGVNLGAYRKHKFLLAATAPFDKVQQENEKDAFQADPSVTHVVIVLHGIRDLGRWSAHFEEKLRVEFTKLCQGNCGKLAVESARYGYFGMGPFLLPAKRQNYVRWLMDEYTEILARYPNAGENIHFAGHSNGTYLLASALEQYSSLQIKRVAFGGSVVRSKYDWDDKRVEKIRNYVAADDWIVALFPRFFEPTFMRFFGNDLGSAGFAGFSKPSAKVENVQFLEGGHDAFLGRTEEISRFLLHDDASIEPVVRQKAVALYRWGWSWGTWLVVWPLLGLLIVGVGWYAVMAGSEPRWPLLLGYTALVFAILQRA